MRAMTLSMLIMETTPIFGWGGATPHLSAGVARNTNRVARHAPMNLYIIIIACSGEVEKIREYNAKSVGDF